MTMRFIVQRASHCRMQCKHSPNFHGDETMETASLVVFIHHDFIESDTRTLPLLPGKTGKTLNSSVPGKKMRGWVNEH